MLMPVRNAGSTVSRAVQSILDQTLADFELVVVDDGSTDDTPAILARAAGLDPRIRLITTLDRGLVKALNTGLRLCRAPFVARMDGDDLSRPDRLEKQFSFLRDNPEYGLVSGQVGFLGDKKKSYGYYLYVRWLNTLSTHQDISLNRFVESPLAHPSVMFRTSLATDLGGYADGPFPEDYELWLRWLDQGVKMAKIPCRVLDWQDHETRLSRTHPNYSIEAFFRLKAGYLARWLAKYNPFHPRIWIWGAGRQARQRAEHLSGHGCCIAGYIDIRESLAGNFIQGRPIRHYLDLPAKGECFMLAYVRKRNARQEIRAFLQARGYVEGIDFLLAA